MDSTAHCFGFKITGVFLFFFFKIIFKCVCAHAHVCVRVHARLLVQMPKASWEAAGSPGVEVEATLKYGCWELSRSRVTS